MHQLILDFETIFVFGEILLISRCFFSTKTNHQDSRCGPTDMCRNSLNNLKMFTLTSLYILDLCVCVYRKNIFISHVDIHNIEIRSKQKLSVPYSRLKLTSNAPQAIGPKLYNELPKFITVSKTPTLFKRRLSYR